GGRRVLFRSHDVLPDRPRALEWRWSSLRRLARLQPRGPRLRRPRLPHRPPAAREPARACVARRRNAGPVVPAGVPAQREAAVLPHAQPLAARAEVLLDTHAARARARVRLLRGAPARVARRPGARVRLAPRRRLAVAQAARAGGRAPRGPGLAPRPRRRGPARRPGARDASRAGGRPRADRRPARQRAAEPLLARRRALDRMTTQPPHVRPSPRPRGGCRVRS